MKIEVGEIYGWAQGYTGARFHACLCDPPYELGFMGMSWDRSGVAFRAETWAAIADCLLPGAFLLAFGGTRTWHRLAVAIEDAGFEIRDTIMWVYGSGLPKSHDVSKAIDKAAGAEREVVEQRRVKGGGTEHINRMNAHVHEYRPGDYQKGQNILDITLPSTEAAKQWDGYGTALKPAWEPVIVARKPLQGTVAENCVEYGSGALWIEGGKVDVSVTDKKGNGGSIRVKTKSGKNSYSGGYRLNIPETPGGRWPANVIHDGSEEVVGLFPDSTSTGGTKPFHDAASFFREKENRVPFNYADSGSAARFFYCTKASRSERDAGCEGMEERARPTMGNGIGGQPDQQRVNNHNHHPTVKPIALTEYLAKLILPPIAYAPRRLLVPFAGSGSEMIGAHRAGWEEIVGIEMNAEYVEIAEARLRHWTRQMVMAV